MSLSHWKGLNKPYKIEMLRNDYSMAFVNRISDLSLQVTKGINYKEMEEDLTCPVCLELYADPLMMPCSHSVCKACLQEIMQSRLKIGKQELECPACRENHHLSADQVNQLPKNLALENIVIRYQEIQSNSLSKAGRLDISESRVLSHSLSTASDLLNDEDVVFEESTDQCGICEEGERKYAEWFCPQCQVLYCQLCMETYHPKRGSLSTHKIRRPSVRSEVPVLYCPDHRTEAASIFCDTCKVIACHLCVCQGQGSHCTHAILDLDTAGNQLQESVERAKADLSSIITLFSNQHSAIGSKMQELKIKEEIAKNDISHQCKCILSDVAALLHSAKKTSLNAIASIVAQSSSHLGSKSQHVQALLTQSENLKVVCEDLLSTHESENYSRGSSSTPDVMRTTSTDKLSYDESTNSVSLSSVMEASNLVFEKNESYESSYNPQTNICKKTRGRTVEVMKEKISEKSANFETQENRNYRTAENESNFVTKKRSSSESKSPAFSSLPEGKATNECIVPLAKQLSADCLSLKSKLLEKGPTQNLPAVHSIQERLEDLMSTRKSNTTCHLKPKLPKENLISKQQTLSTSCGMKEGKEATQNSCTSAQSILPTKSHENIATDNKLLVRADEVGPVLEQVSLMLKESQYQEKCIIEGSEVPVSPEARNIQAYVAEFHMSSLSLLNSLSANTPVDCSVITPAVRSVVSTPTLGLPVASRVHSRTLITWGFNSTTFTADPLEDCCQWSVNISRNASHIGDIKSGYLFGVGVSTKPLSSKEQVGMNPASHAVICLDGKLAVCHGSQVSPIMPLSDLPVAVTISVAKIKMGHMMMYDILPSGSSSAICGRRIVTIPGECSAVKGDIKEEGQKLQIFPIFTLSQRVKMQFPLSSDV